MRNNFNIPALANYKDADIGLIKFLSTNGIFEMLVEYDCVVSKISDSTYGTLRYSSDKIIFCKHKHVKGKGIQKTYKFISPSDVDMYFRKTHEVEISILEMQEEKLNA